MRTRYRSRTKQPVRQVRTTQGQPQPIPTPAELYNKRFERWGYTPDKKDRTQSEDIS